MIYVIHNGRLLPVPAGGATFQEQQQASSFEAQQQGSSESVTTSKPQSTTKQDTPKSEVVQVADTGRSLAPGIYKNPETAETFTLESSGEERRRVTRYQVLSDGRVLALAGNVALTDKQYESIPNAPQWLRTYAFVTPLDTPTTLEKKTITSSDTPEEKRQKTKVIIEETQRQVTDRLRKYRDGSGYDVAAILRDKAATEEELRLIGLSNDAIKAAERTNKRAEEMRKANERTRQRLEQQQAKAQASFTKKAELVLDAIDDEGSIAGALQARAINRSDLKRYLVKSDGSRFTDKDIDQILEGDMERGVTAVERGRVARQSNEIKRAVAQGKLTKLKDGTLLDTKALEALPASLQTIAKQDGYQALTRAIDKYNDQVKDQLRGTVAVGKSGERISKADYEALSPFERQYVKREGVRALNEYIGKRNAEQTRIFERNHVKLDTGEYVAKDAFNKLSKPDQRELKKRGVAGFIAAQDEGGFATLADVREVQRLYGEGKPEEARALQKQIEARRPLLTGLEATKQGGRAALSLVPVVGTVLDWDEMGPAMKGLSIAADVAFVLGAARAVGASAKAAGTLKGSTAVAGTTRRTQQAARSAKDIAKAVRLEQKAALNAARTPVAKAAAKAQADYFENALKMARLEQKAGKLSGAANAGRLRRVNTDIAQTEKALSKARDAVKETTEALVKRYSGGKDALPTNAGPLKASRLADDILDSFNEQVKAASAARPRSRAAILREAKRVRRQLDDASVRATDRGTLAENIRESQRLTDANTLALQRRMAALRTELAAQRAYQLGNLADDIAEARENVRALRDLARKGDDTTDLAASWKYRNVRELPAAEAELRRLEVRQRAILRQQPALFDVADRPKRPLSPRDDGGDLVPAGVSEYTRIQDEILRKLAEANKLEDGPAKRKLLLEIQDLRRQLRTASREAKIGFTSGGVSGGLRNVTKTPVPEAVSAVTPSTIEPVTIGATSVPKPVTTPSQIPGAKTGPGAKPSTTPTGTPKTRPGTPEPSPSPSPQRTPKVTGGPAPTTIGEVSGATAPDIGTGTGSAEDTPTGQPSPTPKPARTGTLAGGDDDGGGRRKPGTPTPKRFRLPDGQSLPPGQYPKVATFLMGPFRHTVDFEKGTRQIDASVRSGKPDETFQVLEIMNEPPKAQTFRQGAFIYRVDQNNVTFDERERPARWDDPVRPLFRVRG